MPVENLHKFIVSGLVNVTVSTENRRKGPLDFSTGVVYAKNTAEPRP